MRKITLLLFVCVCMFFVNAIAQQWTSLGPDDTNGNPPIDAPVNNVSMAFDPLNNRLYIAYTIVNTNAINVRMWDFNNPTGWVQVGAIADASPRVSITVTFGTPFVAYHTGGGFILVQGFDINNSNTWTIVGGPIQGSFPSITHDNTGLYVAYRTNIGFAAARHLPAPFPFMGLWQDIAGPTAFPAFGAGEVSIALNMQHSPHISYVDAFGFFRVQSVPYGQFPIAGGWQDVGAPTPPLGGGMGIASEIRFNSLNQIFMTAFDNGMGSLMQPDPNPNNPWMLSYFHPSDYVHSLAFNNTNNPIVAFGQGMFGPMEIIDASMFQPAGVLPSIADIRRTAMVTDQGTGRLFLLYIIHNATRDDIYVRMLTPTPLDITLKEFTAAKQDNTAALKWITTTEKNNDGFIIQRSMDGKNFENIGEVKGAGNSNQEKAYGFTDHTPKQGTNYYRLRWKNDDGSIKYSETRQLNFTTKNSLQLLVYPNPAVNKVMIKSGETIVSVKFMSIDGKLVKEEKINNQSASIDIGYLPTGTYTVIAVYANGKIETRTIQKSTN